MAKRITVIALALTVLGFSISICERDPFVWVPLFLFDGFLAVLLLSGWRRIAQDEKDAADLARMRAARADRPDA